MVIKYQALSFIDLKKVFDLVSHKVPLDKIGIYSRTVRTVKWFESYLSQSVEVNSTISSLMSVKQGVPQGSIVGPIFFLLFVNDLQLYVSNSNFLTLIFARMTQPFHMVQPGIMINHQWKVYLRGFRKHWKLSYKKQNVPQ